VPAFFNRRQVHTLSSSGLFNMGWCFQTQEDRVATIQRYKDSHCKGKETEFPEGDNGEFSEEEDDNLEGLSSSGSPEENNEGVLEGDDEEAPEGDNEGFEEGTVEVEDGANNEEEREEEI